MTENPMPFYGSAFGEDNWRKTKDVRNKKTRLVHKAKKPSLTAHMVRHAAQNNEYFLCGKPNRQRLPDIVAPLHGRVSCNGCQRTLNAMNMGEKIGSYVPL